MKLWEKMTFFNPNLSDQNDKKPINRVQLNPNSAISKSKTRSMINSLMLITGAVLLFMIFQAGNITSLKTGQKLNVSANIDFKNSLVGSVTEVNVQENYFKLKLEYSYSDLINASTIKDWIIILPPGTKMNKMSGEYKLCYQVKSISAPQTDSKLTTCENIIKTGRKLLVEYAVINDREGRIIAKNIIGE